jgi:hypothetical protein
MGAEGSFVSTAAAAAAAAKLPPSCRTAAVLPPPPPPPRYPPLMNEMGGETGKVAFSKKLFHTKSWTIP